MHIRPDITVLVSIYSLVCLKGGLRDVRPPLVGKVDSSKNGVGQCPRRALKLAFEDVAMLSVCRPEALGRQITLLLLFSSHSV